MKKGTIAMVKWHVFIWSVRSLHVMWQILWTETKYSPNSLINSNNRTHIWYIRTSAEVVSPSLSTDIYIIIQREKEENMERSLMKKTNNNNTNSTRSNSTKDNELFHVIHKVPCGDTPYVKAKHAQVQILLLHLWGLFLMCIIHQESYF